MEEKLYLRNRGDGDYFIESRTNNSASVVGSLNPTHFAEHKLSLKNCQAIELGYDLDELADEFSRKFPNDSEPIRYASFIIGFQKALSILGDKKFSAEDIKKSFNKGYLMKFNPSDEYHETLNGLVQQLQQTEWDVEIVMEYKPINHASGLELTGHKLMDVAISQNYQPKLDAEGNLILKRK